MVIVEGRVDTTSPLQRVIFALFTAWRSSLRFRVYLFIKKSHSCGVSKMWTKPWQTCPHSAGDWSHHGCVFHTVHRIFSSLVYCLLCTTERWLRRETSTGDLWSWWWDKVLKEPHQRLKGSIASSCISILVYFFILWKNQFVKGQCRAQTCSNYFVSITI